MVETFRIIGPPPTPGMHCWAERARDQRIERALAEYRSSVDTRADSTAVTYCPNCDEPGFDASAGYCPRCGYSSANGYDLAAHRARPTHACPGCQSPTSDDRCAWCKRWESIEARSMARFGTITEHQLSRLAAEGW